MRRGTELAAEQGLKKCSFQVMNALHMDYPDNSFDLVWACESGEHMPDKKAYVEEMTRVLKPGMLIKCNSKVLGVVPKISLLRACRVGLRKN